MHWSTYYRNYRWTNPVINWRGWLLQTKIKNPCKISPIYKSHRRTIPYLYILQSSFENFSVDPRCYTKCCSSTLVLNFYLLVKTYVKSAFYRITEKTICEITRSLLTSINKHFNSRSLSWNWTNYIRIHVSTTGMQRKVTWHKDLTVDHHIGLTLTAIIKWIYRIKAKRKKCWLEHVHNLHVFSKL